MKNTVKDLQSKKKTWDDLKIPEKLKHHLFVMKMDKPSIIQATAIPKILERPNENFLFQALNGSGKTLSFGIPSILAADPTIPNIQVLIIANTRELIRQV